MPILLCVGDGDTDVSGFYLLFVNHGRPLHGVLRTVGKERPHLTILRSLNLILIEESGILELSPYLAKLLCLAEVYLQPLVVMEGTLPVGMTRLPQCAVVIVDSIFRLEPVIIVAGCRHLSTVGNILL